MAKLTMHDELAYTLRKKAPPKGTVVVVWDNPETPRYPDCPPYQPAIPLSEKRVAVSTGELRGECLVCFEPGKIEGEHKISWSRWEVVEQSYVKGTLLNHRYSH